MVQQVTVPSVLIKDILESQSVGTFGASTGFAIAIGYEPEAQPGKTPHTMITLFDDAGPVIGGKSGDDRLAINIRVRGAPQDYQAAYRKAYQVMSVLTSHPKVEDGLVIFNIECVNSPASLGRDKADRHSFSLNFILWVGLEAMAHQGR